MSIAEADLNRAISDYGRVGVVAHDAGAAHHILAWLVELGEEVPIAAAGPAAELFRSRGMAISSKVESVVAEVDWLLSGTGWATDFEIRGVDLANRCGLKTVCVLDHWVNFQDRFRIWDASVLPAMVVVTDEYAYRLALQELPGLIVSLWPNAQAISLHSEVNQLRSKIHEENHESRVLLLGEPTRRNLESCQGQPEESLISWVSSKSHLSTVETAAITLRLHPAERLDKYSAAIDVCGFPILVSDPSTSSLANDLAKATVVIGLTTYALYLSWASGIPSYSLARRAALTPPFPPGTVPQC